MKICHCVLGGTLACLSCSCVMVNSSATTSMDTALFKSRTTETRAIHSSSNTVSTGISMEGGGKVDATVPLGKVP